MEKKHKEILIAQRANLVENLNVRDGLFTQLITRKVLKQRTVRSMQTGRTLDEQAEALLDELPKLSCGPNAFDRFCESLIEDGQEAIVDLYLRPDTTNSEEECSKNDGTCKKNVGVEESSRASSVSDTSDSVHDDVIALQKLNSSYPSEIRPGEATASFSGTTGCHLPSIAIREEYEHQMYRRSIEPTTNHDQQMFTSTKTPSGGNFEQEARFFFQNSLLDPGHVTNSVYSVLKDPRLTQIEKQKILSSISSSESGIGSSVKKNPAFSESQGQSPYGKGDPLLVRDSSCKVGQTSSQLPPLLPGEMFAQTPSVFTSLPSLKESSNLSQNHNIKGTDPFSFQTAERLENLPYNKVPKSDTMTLHQPTSIGQGHINTEMNLRSLAVDQEHLLSQRREPSINEIRPLSSKNISIENSFNNNNLEHVPVPSRTSSLSPSVYKTLERDSIEMPPRFIEVIRTEGNDSLRDMISLPRYIERAHPPSSVYHYSRLQNEELASRVENIEVGCLARNDSVDTMHKRPFTENQDANGTSKRFREDVDNIQEFQKPEKLTTLKVYNKLDNQVITIPVIDEPQKLPSRPAVVIETEKDHRGSLLGMDDPEIDLTDGPINVKVELSTRQFYLGHYKQAYNMRSIPRGKALILNVNEVVGKSPRRGTDIDRDNLHNLLCQLHYDVTVYNDIDGLTAKEMVLKLQDFSQDVGHKTADCAFICILSHGEEGYIFGSDGKKFELDAVFSLFDNACCANLRGKPKIFIIQACRGGALDSGVKYYPDEHDGSDARIRQVPSLSDMLICYPTQNGYYAWRNRDRGSWYVEALVQVFMKYAKCEDLCTMLNRVNLLVSKKVSHCPTVEMDQMSQMSEYKSTLRMPHLFLFPGIGSCV